MKQASPAKITYIATIGMFLSTLDSGIINIAIPSLIRTFDTTANTVIWTVSLYTLVLSISILFFGRIADKFGRLKIYALGLCLFAISSFLCGLANSIVLLIIFRGLQGLSAAMMQATSMALITSRLQGHDLLKAMGIFGLLIGLGPMLGPVLGGMILDTVGWQWIFWLNIPICLLGLYGCYCLPKSGEVLQQKPIPYIHFLLLGLALFSFLLTIMLLQQINVMFIVGLSMAALVFFTAYFYLDSKTKNAIIPLNLFKDIKFLAPMMGVIAFGGATTIALLLPPLYFEQLRHFPAWQVGLISLAAPLGIMFAARLSVKIVQGFGTIKPMLCGLCIMLLNFLILTQIKLNWPVYLIFILLLVYGIGGGLFQTPCYLNVTQQFSVQEQAFIGSLIRMIQNLAIAVQAAIAGLLIHLALETQNNLLLGIKQAWLMSTIIIAIALIFFIINFLGSRKNDSITI